jgi:hypothetical protein
MKATRALLAACAALALVALAGCGGGGGSSAPATITVTVNPATITVKPGNSQTFSATVDGPAVDKSVVWSVREANGGTITAAGRYTSPLLEGTFHVVATSVADSTKSGEAAVKVRASLGNVILDTTGMPSLAQSCKSSVTIDVGGPFEITATTNRPAGGILTPAVISVEEGQYACSVTAYSQANATGVAMASGIVKGATVTRNVDNHVALALTTSIAQVLVTPVNQAVDPGAKSQFAVSFRNVASAVIPTNAPVWDTSDHAVATVDQSGLVTAISAGTVRVTATDTESGKSGFTNLTVNAVQTYDPGLSGTYSNNGATLDTNKDGENKSVTQTTALPGGGYVILDQVGTVRLLNPSGARTAIATPGGTNYRGALAGNVFWVACAGQGVVKRYDCSNGLSPVGSPLAFGRYNMATFVPETGMVLLSGEDGLLEVAASDPSKATPLKTSAVYGATGDAKYIWYSYGSKIYKIDRDGHDQGSFDAPNIPYDILAVPGYNVILVADVAGKKVVWLDKSGASLGSRATPDGSQVRAFGLAGTAHEGYMPSNSSPTSYGWRITPVNKPSRR